MKTNLFLLITFISLFSFSAFSQIKVDCNGKVGIGYDIDPAYALTLSSVIFKTGGGYPDLIMGPNPSGTQSRTIYPTLTNTGTLGVLTNQFYAIYAKYHYANGVLLTSDKRLKENFRTIDHPLDKLLQMNGQKQDFISQVTDTIKDVKEEQKQLRLEKNRLGFVAQDLEKILPDAVFYFEDEDRYYIEYNAIIPVIVEAMKEQQAIIQELKDNMAAIEANNSNNTLKSASIAPGESDNITDSKATLDQNTPNSFSQTTTIGYTLNEKVQKAMICIYDMNGAQLKCIPLELSLHGNITINGNEFKAGMYMYSLITDGQLIDTKRMILTD